MSFKVYVEPSGHEFTVDAGESILDAALRQGLTMPYGCRSGFCGSCKGKLVSGEVEYENGEPETLSDQDRLVGMALFCIARPSSDITIEVKEIETAAEIPVKNFNVKIARKEKFSEDVLGIWLKMPDDHRLQYLAGQYIDILLPDGRKRAFSIANAPHDDAYLQLHIRRIAGGSFTTELFENTQEKSLLRVEGPKGNFYLREDSDRPIILLATGTGFAPVKALIEHAIAEGVSRPMHLYWGGRVEADLYMQALARSWAETHDNIYYTPVLSQPAAGWMGRTGYVQQAVMEDFDDLSGFEVYACGLPRMVHEALDALAARGLDAGHYYSDAFEFASDSRAAAEATNGQER